MIAAGLELLKPEVRRDPYQFYARGRRETPVQRIGSLDTFLVYRHADVQAILRDGNLWQSPETTLRPPNDDKATEGQPGSEAPDRRLRGLLTQVFAPRVMPRLVREREAHLRELVDDLLDRALEVERVDLVDALSSPLPVTVIAEILGIPVEDREQFRAWSNSITSASAGTDMFGRLADPAAKQKRESACAELYDYFALMAEARRRDPRDDLITALAHAEFDGAPISHAEMLEILVLLLIAGNENTTSLIGNSVVQFVRSETMAAIRDDLSLLPTAIEEVLRFESPFPFDPRIASRAVDLQGVRIERGQMVLALLGSANRDETVFERADQFDIRRSPNRHIAFGFGVHFCLGASLARLEARIALECLLKRTRNIALATAEPLPLNETTHLRGFSSIPVVMEPA